MQCIYSVSTQLSSNPLSISSSRTLYIFQVFNPMVTLIGFSLLVGTFKVSGKELITTVLDAALSAGYRLIDTASVYRNEADIGSALPVLMSKHGLQRSDLFITSKLAPSDHGAGKCRAACLRSLELLGLDYLDLYLIHWPGVQGLKSEDPRLEEIRLESWKDMEQLYNEGKLKSVGVSNYTERHLSQLLDKCRVIPAVLQTEHHPHLQQTNAIDVCRRNNIFLQAYSSLGTSNSDNQLLSDASVRDIALEIGKTPAQVLLRWAVQQGVGVIPKSTNEKHLIENAGVFDFTLSPEQMDRLDRLNSGSHYCWNPENVS